MSKKIEKMRWAAEDKIYRRDEWIRQDNEELLMTDELREFILSSKNQFLLIGRNCEGFPVPWDAFCVPKISKNLIEFERMYNGVSFNYGR